MHARLSTSVLVVALAVPATFALAEEYDGTVFVSQADGIRRGPRSRPRLAPVTPVGHWTGDAPSCGPQYCGPCEGATCEKPFPSCWDRFRACFRRKCTRCSKAPFQGYLHGQNDLRARPICSPVYVPAWGYYETCWRPFPEMPSCLGQCEPYYDPGYGDQAEVHPAPPAPARSLPEEPAQP